MATGSHRSQRRTSRGGGRGAIGAQPHGLVKSMVSAGFFLVLVAWKSFEGLKYFYPRLHKLVETKAWRQLNTPQLMHNFHNNVDF